MNNFLKYIILIMVSPIPVCAMSSLQGIYSCVINNHVSNGCDNLFTTSILMFFLFSGLGSIGVVLIGLPWFISLRNQGKDTFLNVVVWPAAAFSFVIFFLFGVYVQGSYITFVGFSGFWLFTAGTLWYAAKKLGLASKHSDHIL